MSNEKQQEPLSKTRVIALMQAQSNRYASMKQSLNGRDENPDGSEAPEIDSLIETRHAYQLLADQARMFASLVSRISESQPTTTESSKH